MVEKLHAEKLEELTAKRTALIEKLRSTEHYEATPTVYYGGHDPFEVPIAMCDSCNSAAEIKEISAGLKKTRWAVSCTCCDKRTPHPQKDSWMAALVWNGVNLASQSYKSLPLFGLTHLTPLQAREMISKVRDQLVLRINLCNVDKALAEAGHSLAKPGLMYQQRLDAYLKWAMFAHRLIKVERSQGLGAQCDNSTEASSLPPPELLAANLKTESPT